MGDKWLIIKIVGAALISGIGGGLGALCTEKLNDQRYAKQYEKHMKEKEEQQAE